MKESKLIVFYPVVPGVGSKYIATNVAHNLKEREPEKKIALVDFDFHAPYLAGYLTDTDKIHGIDNLTDKIDGGFLDEVLFKENMVPINGIDVLKGTKSGKNHFFIEQKHVEEILMWLRSLYDVVIISVSSDSDNAGTSTALFHADQIVVVSQNNFTSYSQFDIAMDVVNFYKNDKSVLRFVYNQYFDGSNLDFTPHLQTYGLDVIGVVPFNSDSIDNRDLKGKVFGNILKRKKQETPFDEISTGLALF